MAPTIDFTQYRGEDGSATKRRQQGTYTGPTSYATGGDPFTPADVKLGQLHVITGMAVARKSDGTVRLLWYDKTNQKVIWYVPNTGAEVANATDLSGYTVDFEAIGL